MIDVDGNTLGLEQVAWIARGTEPVGLSPEAIEAIEHSRRCLDTIVSADAPVYGINTGFGIFADRRIPRRDGALLSRNLILSHAVGTGPALPEEIVLAYLAIKLESGDLNLFRRLLSKESHRHASC